MKRTILAYSTQPDCGKACDEIFETIQTASGNKTPIALIFTAPTDSFREVSLFLASKYPETEVIGSTGYVHFCSLGYNKKAICAFAIMDGIECVGGVISDISFYPLSHAAEIKAAVGKLSSTGNTCCYEITTAFSHSEELVQDTFRQVLSAYGIPVVGGTSGNEDEEAEISYVSLNGEVYKQACVYLLLHNLCGKIFIYRDTTAIPTGISLITTDVDCDERAVYEFNNQPAAHALAAAMHIPVNELSKEASSHPIGRIEGDNIYIADIERIYPDGHVTFFSRIYNHTKCVLLEHRKLQSVGHNTLTDLRDAVPVPSFMLVINCMGRSKFYLEEDVFGPIQHGLGEYAPYIGLSGLGEQCEYQHFNHTMLITVFE